MIFRKPGAGGARALLLPVLALLLLAALACQRDVERVDALDSWEYTALSEKTQSAFTLSFKLSPETSSAFRLLFGDSGNGAGRYLEFDSRGIHSGTIRDNVEFGREMLSRVSLSELADAVITVEGRRHRWSLDAGGQLLATGDDIIKPGEAISFGVAGGRVKVTRLRFQPSPGIYFTDSFMRTQEDPTSWFETFGTWNVSIKNDPLLSANAFSYRGSGSPEAASIVGDDTWGDIDISVACRPSGPEGVGVYVCYRAPDDYFLFRWSGRDSESPMKQLIRRKGDVERILVEEPGGYAVDQWHTIGALTGCGWARFRLDDTLIFSVHDNDLTHGKVGLYVGGEAPASFDDFRAETRPASLVDFNCHRLAKWLIAGGEWKQIAATGADPALWSGGILARTTGAAQLLWGQALWQDYVVGARLMPWEKGTLGLCFRYQDDENYYSIRWKKASAPVLELWRTEQGEAHVLKQLPMTDDMRPHDLSVATKDDEITVYVDGDQVLHTMDAASVYGRAGFYAEDVSSGLFSELFYAALPGEKPVANIHKSFSAEKEMGLWANALSDWQQGADTENEGDTRHVWWHRSSFHGDVRVELRLTEPPAVGAEIGVVLNGDIEDNEKGIRARLFWPDNAGTSPQDLMAELYRDGVLCSTAALQWHDGPRVLRLKRVGDTAALSLGEETLLTCDVATESSGHKIGWYAKNYELTTDDADIYSDNFINDTFTSAPADWREGSGIWEVTNKWECDPRWSFFSGRSEDVAVLWNKRPLFGDFEIEYYIGNKMNRAEGWKYEYAQDMNITVCADGKDLTSGYSFVFGGFDNTVTAIYRESERKVEAPIGRDTRITRGNWLHRNWYHFAVSRKGSLLEMRVNGNVIMSMEEDEPLKGGHWALWTNDNGIVVARVRVTAEEIGPRDAPDKVWPQKSRTIYDEREDQFIKNEGRL